MSTVYRYVTGDGKAPNGGAPPGAPSGACSFNPMITSPGPLSCCSSPPQSYVCVPAPAPLPCVCHPVIQPPSSAPPSVYYSFPAPPSPPRPVPVVPTPSWAPPAYTNDSAPPRGGRVKGLPAVLPGGIGLISGPRHCMIHLFKGKVKPWLRQGQQLEWQAYLVPTDMKVREFIQQIQPAEGPPADTPEQEVGVCQVLEYGDGTWLMGSRFVLGDAEYLLQQTLAQLGWDSDRGEAGRGKPVWLVRMP